MFKLPEQETAWHHQSANQMHANSSTTGACTGHNLDASHRTMLKSIFSAFAHMDGNGSALSKLAKGYCPVSLGVSVVQAMSVVSQAGHESAVTLLIPTRTSRSTLWRGFILLILQGKRTGIV